MKGLLIKDFYMFSKYCRTFALLLLVFCVTGAFGGENVSAFMLFYPCIIAGMLPVTLISYDERDKWVDYTQALPYSRAQLVSCKYTVGLILEGAVVLLTLLAQSARLLRLGIFSAGELMGLCGVLFPAALLPASILLPFIFKFGSEKGRIAYYIVIIGACAGTVALAEFLPGGQIALKGTEGQLIAIAASVIAYALSWLLSIHFYKKREL